MPGETRLEYQFIVCRHKEPQPVCFQPKNPASAASLRASTVLMPGFPKAAGLCYSTGKNRSAAVPSSRMPARSALGCSAPDLGNPHIASIVRRTSTWVMPAGAA
jgi:hypothetical protein